MRVHYSVLFNIAIVAVRSNAILLAKDLSEVSPHSALGVQVGASTNRYLRIHDVTEDDEERVFSIKSIPAIEKASNFLSNNILASYLKNDKNVDDVFVKLKLNSPNKNVFENPEFLKWTQYVDDFNRKHFDMEPQSMFRTLMRHYGDIQLSSMLEAATKVESTRDVATKLQGEQMKLWERRGVTSKQLFKALKLNIFDDGVTNLLASPSMNTWIKYADKVDPGPRMTLFDKLRNAYSDDTMLSKLLTTGMKDPNTKKLANELQAKQVNRWLDELQPPDNVFKFLSLDKGADGLLANPQLRTWVTYSDSYKANNEFTTKLSLTEVLTKHYKDKDLVIMIRSAKSKREFEYAQSIQDALLDKWAKARKPVGEVLEALGVTGTQAQNNGVMEAYNKKFLALNPK